VFKPELIHVSLCGNHLRNAGQSRQPIGAPVMFEEPVGAAAKVSQIWAVYTQRMFRQQFVICSLKMFQSIISFIWTGQSLLSLAPNFDVVYCTHNYIKMYKRASKVNYEWVTKFRHSYATCFRRVRASGRLQKCFRPPLALWQDQSWCKKSI